LLDSWIGQDVKKKVANSRFKYTFAVSLKEKIGEKGKKKIKESK